MRAYASSMYNRLSILLVQVGYLGIDVSSTSLPQWPTLLFLLIYIMYKHITPNTIYYHSHTFSLMIYNVSIMYTAWCLTLYHKWPGHPLNLGHSQYIIILIYYQYHSNIAIPYYHIVKQTNGCNHIAVWTEIVNDLLTPTIKLGPTESLWQFSISVMQSCVVMWSSVDSSLTPHLMSTT